MQVGGLAPALRSRARSASARGRSCPAQYAYHAWMAGGDCADRDVDLVRQLRLRVPVAVGQVGRGTAADPAGDTGTGSACTRAPAASRGCAAPGDRAGLFVMIAFSSVALLTTSTADATSRTADPPTRGSAAPPSRTRPPPRPGPRGRCWSPASKYACASFVSVTSRSFGRGIGLPAFCAASGGARTGAPVAAIARARVVRRRRMLRWVGVGPTSPAHASERPASRRKVGGRLSLQRWYRQRLSSSIDASSVRVARGRDGYVDAPTRSGRSAPPRPT